VSDRRIPSPSPAPLQVELVGSFQHPHVVRLLAFCPTAGHPAMAFEYAPREPGRAPGMVRRIKGPAWSVPRTCLKTHLTRRTLRPSAELVVSFLLHGQYSVRRSALHHTLTLQCCTADHWALLPCTVLHSSFCRAVDCTRLLVRCQLQHVLKPFSQPPFFSLRRKQFSLPPPPSLFPLSSPPHQF